MKIVFCLLCLLTGTFCSKITGFKSAKEAICDEYCLKMVEKFKQEYSHGWAIRHPSISAHYAKSNCRVCVEIGVARGELSHYLLKNLNHQIEEYYAIDPFLGGYDDKNDAMSVELTQMNSPQVWANAVLHVMSVFGDKFRLFQNISQNIINNFPEQSVDCVFIDGDHTYEGVKSDISLWYPKVKNGGVLFFDDVSRSFPGTVKAVDEFVENNKLIIKQINKHNNYLVLKPHEAASLK